MRTPTRRLTAVAAAGLLACATAVAGFVPAATAEPDASTQQVQQQAVVKPTLLDASNFRYDLTEMSSTMIAALDADLPNVSLSDVANDSNRQAEFCEAEVERRIASFCWNSGDAATSLWYPQGVTTSSDALGVGMYDGKRILMASWYDHADDGIEKGVRISIVDLTNGTSAPRYRHILLVEPTGSDMSPSFRALEREHAGGIMWYGNLLYVTDTDGGFRVFDLDHLWQVSTGDESRIGRQADGTFHAFNYKYVLPQTAKFLHRTVNDHEPIRHSSVSLDRSSTPDSVIVTEYQRPSDVELGKQVRSIRVPIDYEDRYLKPASDGVIKATEAARIYLASVQGSAAINGKVYYSQSHGEKTAGDLHTWVAPSGAVVPHEGVLPVGPEDLSYDPIRDQMWSLSEHVGERYVYSFDAGGF